MTAKINIEMRAKNHSMARTAKVRPLKVDVPQAPALQGKALIDWLCAEAERKSRPRVQLFFQERPYNAWVMRVAVETDDLEAVARTWFDDYTERARPPSRDITELAAQHLRKVAVAALLYAEQPQSEISLKDRTP
jgi:hypothetical protein